MFQLLGQCTSFASGICNLLVGWRQDHLLQSSLGLGGNLCFTLLAKRFSLNIAVRHFTYSRLLSTGTFTSCILFCWRKREDLHEWELTEGNNISETLNYKIFWGDLVEFCLLASLLEADNGRLSLAIKLSLAICMNNIFFCRKIHVFYKVSIALRKRRHTFLVLGPHTVNLSNTDIKVTEPNVVFERCPYSRDIRIIEGPHIMTVKHVLKWYLKLSQVLSL